MKTNCREVLRPSLFAAVTCAAALAALAELSNPQPNPRPSTPSGRLIDSAPMLQNPAPTSMGVAFAVSAMANGFVELSESPDMTDARKVRSGGFRVTGLDPRVQLVRLTGLREATRYYYRIGADRIKYDPIRSKVLGTEVDPKVRSFTTSGAGAESSFCAINDTHIQWEPLDLVLGKTEELKPAVLIHLGDASETMPTVESQVEMFLAPPVKNNAYAAERGVLFCPGNHDQWGFANRTLERVFMFRQPEERASRDWDLGRNFAFRQGDIALIGLDTGIHWRDDYPQTGGVFANDAYRVAQTRWLAEVLERPDIKSAPYIVANCHVPVYDRTEEPDRIDWQRAWGELFTKAGVQVVLVGHTHVYRYDPPTADRTWAQIVGGSPNMELPDFPDRWPTVIHGRVEKGALRITVHDTLYKRIAGDFTYKPRGGVALFNGRDLSGWTGATHMYVADASEPGVLRCEQARIDEWKTCNLFTEREYGDFVLRFECNMAKGANNGVGIRMPEKIKSEPAWESFCEVQLIDDDSSPRLKPHQHTGSVYGVIPAKPGADGRYAKPCGEWTAYEIRVVGTTIEVRVDGRLATKGDLAQWKGDGDTVDGKPHPGLHRTRGRIGFLGHYTDKPAKDMVVRFRNILIEEL